LMGIKNVRTLAGLLGAVVFLLAAAPVPTPIVNRLSRSDAPVGTAQFILKVFGSNFAQSSVVRWNGTSRQTVPVGNAELDATISSSDLAVPGTIKVTVFTPPPGGGTSGYVDFKVYVQCGQQIAAWNGIPVYSNGRDQGTTNDCCADHSLCPSEKGTYGPLYQCTELVKRVFGRADWNGDAWTYFAGPPKGVSNGSTPDLKGLIAFANHGVVPPVPDDILVFGQDTYGHVALVSQVSTLPDIHVVEQNWSWTGSWHESLDPANWPAADGTYTVSARCASQAAGSCALVFPVQGWLRRPTARLAISAKGCTSGSCCMSMLSCTGQRGTSFGFTGGGFVPGHEVRRFFKLNGSDVLTELSPRLTAAPNGTLAWSFSSCDSQPGSFTLFALDSGTGSVTNTVSETIDTTPGTCVVLTPGISVQPSPFDFGTVAIGSSKQQNFTITNTGNATLTVNSITFSTPEFGSTVRTPFNVQVAPSNTFVFVASFNPSGTGLRQATMMISSNAPTSSVTLGGTGLNPPPPPLPADGGPAGGNIRALAMAPSDPSTIYAGTAVSDIFEQNKHGGGVFVTTNGSLTWSLSSNGLPDDPVQALAVDPRNPQIVYAGTFARGVFKTVDGGHSWTATNSGLTSLSVMMLAVDSANSNTVYVGMNGGLFRSTTGGQSWASVGSVFGSLAVLSVAFDPTNSSTVYVGTTPIDGSTAGFFKSTDGGLTWFLTNAGLTLPPVGAAPSVTAIAVDPTNTAVLYVGGSQDIFKSVNGGQSWALLNSLLVSGKTVTAIALDPRNPTSLYAATRFSGILKSADGGASWVSMNAGLTDIGIQALTISPMASNNLLVATGSDGVFKSVDGGQSWSSANTGLTARAVAAFAIDPSNPNVLYAASEAALFKSSDAGSTWNTLDSGIAPGQKNPLVFGFLALVVGPTDSDTLYAGGGIPNGVLKSINAGQSWLPANEPFLNQVTGLVVDPALPSNVYAGTISNGVLKSADGGQSWITTPLAFIPPGRTVTSVVLDPVNASIIYAGATGPGGGLFKSIDGALSWTSILNASISSVAAASTASNTTLYAGTTSGDIYKSTDAGQTWSLVETGITDAVGTAVTVQTIAIDPAAPATIYAGTFGAGVFRSTDGGQTWLTTNGGLPNLRVLRVVVDPSNSSTIYAATFGAGVFKTVDGGQTWQPTGAN
jgi:photosystem II stability/assembly factor-like uncharacterized protein/surface antigen